MVLPRRIGRYRLIRRIGCGGMGEVHLAQFEAAAGIRRLVAIKVLLGGADGPREHAALLAEARLSALVSHPNVVQMLDAGVEEGVPWFAMEFVPGLALSDLLRLDEGLIPPWVSARIVADVSAGVHAVHEAKDEKGNFLGVVHRDVTPHNVLLSWDGIVKLADFGVARSSLQSNSTRAGVVKGKLGYLSPEQAGGGLVDRRSDIFALGILLWESLAHRRLFEGATDSETVARVIRCEVPPLADFSSVPPALARVAGRALSADPAARFSTALEMNRAIDAALGEAGVLIGSNEVAQVLAHLAPERVREHEAWLRDEAEGREPSGSATPAQATLTSIEAQLAMGGHRPLTRKWIGVALIVAAAALLTFLRTRQASRDDRAISRVEPSLSGAPEGLRSASPPMPSSSPLAVAPSASFEPSVSPSPPEQALTPKPAPNHSTQAPSERVTGVGTLNLSARPTWATIRVDGKVVGSTPMVLSDVRAGPHVVEALPLGEEPAKRRVVTMTPAATVRVEFVFE